MFYLLATIVTKCPSPGSVSLIWTRFWSIYPIVCVALNQVLVYLPDSQLPLGKGCTQWKNYLLGYSTVHFLIFTLIFQRQLLWTLNRNTKWVRQTQHVRVWRKITYVSLCRIDPNRKLQRYTNKLLNSSRHRASRPRSRHRYTHLCSIQKNMKK